MRINKYLCFALLTFLLISCEKESEESIKLSVHFSNPQAIFLKTGSKGVSKTSTIVKTATLFQLDGTGNIIPVVDSIIVKKVISFSNGLLITLSNDDRYCVYLDNTFFKLPNSLEAELKGENESGDLVFADVSIIRKNSQTIEKLQTTLSNPYVQSMSGNFAIINGDNVFQIFNTITNTRYNVNGCNGPRMVALNGSEALIDDCQSQAMISMATGSRFTADVSSWNSESLYLKNGAALLSQGIAWTAGIQDQSMYGLGIIDVSGNLTIMCNDGFKPGSSSCMNCGDKNSVLFAYGDYFVIRELDKISVVKKGVLTKKVVLNGYNVTSVSVNADKVYFIAEDRFGARVAGVYSLISNTTTVLDTQEEFAEVFTIK